MNRMLNVCGMVIACTAGLGLSAATLHLAGSSQLDDHGRKVENYPYFSWGTELEKYMPSQHKVRNCAKSGHSTKSFRAEGHWQKLLAEVKPGDFVGMQFGANDQKCNTAYYRERRWSDPHGLFRDILREWVEQVRAKGATPIIISHSGRCTFDREGQHVVDHKSKAGVNLGTFTESARTLAEELKCDFVDMQKMVRETSESLGRTEALKNYVISTGYKKGKDGEPSKDTTHPIKSGAEVQARLFMDDVRRRGLSVAKLFERSDFSPEGGFDKAFEKAVQAGGGRVVVPKGTWTAETIRIPSHCDLHLEEGAVLTCSGVVSEGTTYVTLSGKGRLVLTGGDVVFKNCQGVRLRDFTLEGASGIPLKVLGTTDTSVRHMTIVSKDADSLTVAGSRDTTVEKCRFSRFDVEKLRREAEYALVRDLSVVAP